MDILLDELVDNIILEVHAGDVVECNKIEK